MVDDIKKTKAELLAELAELRLQVAAKDAALSKFQSGEDKLSESQVFLEAIFDSTKDGISVLDPELNIIHVNHAMRKWYPELLSLEGKKCYQVYHEKIAPCDVCPTLRALASGKIETEEIQILRSGAPEGTLEIFAYPMLDASGEIVGVIEHVRDITERKRMERELRESVEVNRTLVENLPQKIFLKDKNFVFISCNSSFAKSLNTTPEEIRGKTDYDLYPKETAGRYRSDNARVMESGQIEDTEEREEQDGKDAFVQAVKVPVKNEAGEVTGILGMFWDITERKKAEEELRRYERIVSSSNDMMAFIDRNFVYLAINPAYAKAFGKSRDELVGSTIAEVFGDEYFEANIQDRVKRCLAGENEHYQILVDFPVDGERFMDVHFFPYTDTEGNVQGFVVNGRDITAQNQAERALRKSEERARFFSKHLEVLHEISNELSKAATFDDLCRQAVYLAYNRLGFSRLGIWFVSEASGFLEGSFGISEKGDIRDERGIKVTCTEEFRHLVDKRTRLHRKENTPLFDDISQVVGHGVIAMATLWDGEETIGAICADDLLAPGSLSEERAEMLVLFASTVGHLCYLKRAEEALRENDALIRAVLDHLPVGVAVNSIDPDIMFEYMNDNFLKFYRTTREALANPSGFWNAVYEDPEFREKMKKQVLEDCASGDPNRMRWQDVPITREGEETAYVTARNMPLIDKDLVISTVWDVTERKRSEEERRGLEAQVQHAQKLESLGVLAGGIAHDFNNLLMAILGNADLALSDLSEVSPARPCVEAIEKASIRAADLCKQMLAYSGKGRFQVKNVNLSEVVEEMTHLLKISMSKKVLLSRALAESLPLIEADATQMQQVVMNLITNASEAVGDSNGVVKVSTGAKVCSEEYLGKSHLPEIPLAGQFVYFEVEDTGCGMDEGTKKKLFDPFFTTKFAGRGLGLSAILGIVRSHKGAVMVESLLGEGTTFTVLFPVSENAKNEAQSSETSDSSESWKESGTVLLVDDEESVLQVGKMMLKRIGFDVVVARDGREAVEFFREKCDEIACVILDLTMPRMNGHEAFEIMKQIKSDVPIVISSGYSEEEVTGQFSKVKPVAIVQKPYRLVTLEEKMKQALVQSLDKK